MIIRAFTVVCILVLGVECGKYAIRNFKYDEFTKKIFFKYYDEQNVVNCTRTVEDTEDFIDSICDTSGGYSIVVPGWLENCETRWVVQVIANLTIHRGGCVICMDYGYYSKDWYFTLLPKFDSIARVLTTQLLRLEEYGFAPDKGFIFGFSFGSQLACEAGRRYGPNKLGAIDACDPAGPGFDSKFPPLNHTLSAKNVQCIHTSRDLGSSLINCHQDWRMGFCGYYQQAATIPPYRSHGLCPYIYLAAFDYQFPAIPQPKECIATKAATSWPEDFLMGFFMDRNASVYGELFAFTGPYYPYSPEQDNTFIRIPSDFKKNEISDYIDIE